MKELRLLRALLLLICLKKTLGNNMTLETMSMEDTCAIGAFNVEFLTPIPDKTTSGKVTFPLYTVFGEVTPSSAASRAQFEISCLHKGKDIPITNRRTINGLDMYDCVVQLEEDKCDENVVIITGTVDIPDSKGMPECSRETRRAISYCDGELQKDVSVDIEQKTEKQTAVFPKPSTNTISQIEEPEPNETCNVGDFDLEIRKPKPDPVDPLSVTFPCFASYSVSEVEGNAEFDFRCTSGHPGQLTPGVIKNQRIVEDGVVFDCQLRFTNAEDCDWNVVHVEGKISVGKTNKCTHQKFIKTTYCKKPNESCFIEGFEIQLLEPRPNSNDPHSVTFPSLAVYTEVKVDGEPAVPDFDFRCTSGMLGQLTAGVVKNERKTDEGYMFECDVRFNNTQDCQWNLLTLDGKASVVGSNGQTCEARNLTTTHYCTDSPPEPTRCQRGNLTLEIGEAALAGSDVSFPATLTLDGIVRDDLDSMEFECQLGDRVETITRGAVNIQGPFNDPYEVEFTCSLETSDIYECEKVAVTVTGVLEDDCERNVTGVAQFCPETCAIDDFSVSITEVSPGFLPKTAIADIWVETNMEPEELEKATIEIGCSMSERSGKPESVKRVDGSFRTKCTVHVDDKFDCDRNLLEAAASIKFEGSDGRVVCGEKRKTILQYCAERPAGCLLEEFALKVLDTKEIKSDFFDSKGIATVEAKFTGDRGLLPKLGFTNSCSSGGYKGDTRIVANTEEGYIFQCVFPMQSAFQSLENAIELKATAHLKPHFRRYHQKCNYQVVDAVHYLCSKPQCVLHPVGMAYEANWGLVTDDHYASFVLACTHPTLFCEDCFYLVGPKHSNSIEVEKIGETDKAYHIQANWEYGYQGKITLGIQTERTLRGCDVRVGDIERLTKRFPNCGIETLDSVDIINDMTFFAGRAHSVGVKTLGYKLGSKCTKGHPKTY